MVWNKNFHGEGLPSDHGLSFFKKPIGPTTWHSRPFPVGWEGGPGGPPSRNTPLFPAGLEAINNHCSYPGGQDMLLIPFPAGLEARPPLAKPAAEERIND